jgi:hypothetical protein
LIPKDDSFGARTTALWDDAALEELQGLPPYRPRLLLRWYAHWCKGDENVRLGKSPVTWYHEDLALNEKRALWIFHTRRSSVHGLVPMWDLLNHHNALYNIVSEKHQGGIRYKAAVDIAPGESERAMRLCLRVVYYFAFVCVGGNPNLVK